MAPSREADSLRAAHLHGKMLFISKGLPLKQQNLLNRERDLGRDRAHAGCGPGDGHAIAARLRPRGKGGCQAAEKLNAERLRNKGTASARPKTSQNVWGFSVCVRTAGSSQGLASPASRRDAMRIAQDEVRPAGGRNPGKASHRSDKPRRGDAIASDASDVPAENLTSHADPSVPALP